MVLREARRRAPARGPWTACCARNTAACPAELPPPTSTTSALRAQPWPRSRDAQYQTPRPSNSREVRNRPDGDSARRWRRRRCAPAARRPSSSSRTCTRSRPRVPARSRAARLAGIKHLGAEFLRLHEGACRQRLPGDAGRKAEIVLDARAGAGLSAIGAAVEHDDARALRRRIDRGRRARPDPRRRWPRRTARRGARRIDQARAGAPAPARSD